MRLALFLVLAAWLSAPVAAQVAAGPIAVSTREELLAALRTAGGGETILLADGDYGTIALRGRGEGANLPGYSSPVTVRAANPGGASFQRININDAAGLAFDGIALATSFAAYASRDIAFTNSTGQLLYFRDVDGVRVTGNHVAGGANTLGMWSVANFTIADNRFENAESDLIQITRNSHGGLIENNILRDTRAESADTHPDLIQLLGWDGMNPHDITIRGNYLYDDPATGAVPGQGIFLSPASGEGFRNILIEQNLVAVYHPNTIFVSGGTENVVVRNNSLIAARSGSYRGATIRLARTRLNNAGITVEGNIVRGIIDETRESRIGRNLVYEQSRGIFAGYGAGWEDFRLLNPGRFEGLGAQERFGELEAAQ